MNSNNINIFKQRAKPGARLGQPVEDSSLDLNTPGGPFNNSL